VSREGAPGGTYTSAPSSQSTLSTLSVAPSARPGTAHSTAPPHWMRHQARVTVPAPSAPRSARAGSDWVVPVQFCAPRVGCRRGWLVATFPRPRESARRAPASAWAVWHPSLSPVCSLPRVWLSIYRYSKSFTHYSMRPHAPPSPGRHHVVSPYLARAGAKTGSRPRPRGAWAPVAKVVSKMVVAFKVGSLQYWLTTFSTSGTRRPAQGSLAAAAPGGGRGSAPWPMSTRPRRPRATPATPHWAPRRNYDGQR
jgi:hypothetical protein